MLQSEIMKARAADARRSTLLPAVLLAAAVFLTASCSAPDSEVVFEGAVPDAAPTTLPAAAPDTASPSSAPSTSATEPSLIESPGTTPTTTRPPVTTRLPVTDITRAAPERELDLLTMQVAVNGPSGESVTIFGPRTEQLELYAAEGEFISQPTWSPDGRFVAWSRISAEGAEVAVGRVGGGPVRSFEAPFGVYYMQWRPDGRALGLLGSPDPGRVALAILDLDRETVTPMNASSSYYFHWSPEGNEMITHLGLTGLELLDPATGESSPLGAEAPAGVGFQAASWTPEGRSILYVRPADQEGELRQDELVIHDLDTGEIEVVGAGAGFFNFSLSPDGKSVAYSTRNSGAATVMRVVELATGRAEEIDAPGVFAWQWSPDSRKILLLGIGAAAVTVGVYEEGGITYYQSIVPTDTFLSNYLIFWGQYDLSHTLWAPDSSGFVYAAVDRDSNYVFFQPLDEERPILIGPGSMAAFSPAPAA